MSERGHERGTRAGLAVLFGVTAVAFAVLVVNARRVLPFVSDDALISLRYSDRLIHGHGLTWTDGERVEGYSNLLWVLACALLGAFGIDLVDAARILGFAGMGAAIAAVVYAQRPTRWVHAIPAALGAMTIALACCIGVWAVGGLEQPFVAGLLAWGLALVLPMFEAEGRPGRHNGTWREGLPAGLAFGLLAITRPDGALFGGVAGAALVATALVHRRRLPPALVVLGVPLAFVAAQLLFRLAYYDDVVPNTAHVKLGSSARRLFEGEAYVRGALEGFRAILALAACGVVVDLLTRGKRVRALVLVAQAALWLAYVARIGGDIFPGRRHIVPVVVVLAFLASDFAAWCVEQGKAWVVVFGGAASIAGLTLYGRLQWSHPEIVRAAEERWEWDCKVTASMLGRAFEREQPLVAVDPAGCFPYFSRLPSIDMLGLNDRFIATHPPATRGRADLAHELGDGPYVLQREPDLTLFCEPQGNRNACFPAGVWLDGSREFHSLYRPVLFEGRAPHVFRSWMYARTQGRVGIREDASGWTIPGFFFAERGDVVATSDETGALGTECAPDHPARYSDLATGPGAFDVVVTASAAIARVAIVGAGDAPLATFEGGAGSFVVPGDALAASIVITPVAAGTRVTEVRVRRGAGTGVAAHANGP